jgi:hypothetical protein
METAGRMVEEAARAAGYDPKSIWYQGRSKHGLTVLQNLKGHVWITTAKETAENFADVLEEYYPYRNDGQGEVVRTVRGKVYDLFPATRNPKRISIEQTLWNGEKELKEIEQAKREGHDALIIEHGVKEDMILFSPNQIKSADPVTYDSQGNPIPLSQRFTDSRDIRYQTTAPQDDAFAVEDNSGIIDDFKYNVIDMLAPIEKVYKAIKKSVPEYADFLTKERLRVSKAKADIAEADRKYFTPIKRIIGMSRLTVADVDEFL